MKKMKEEKKKLKENEEVRIVTLDLWVPQFHLSTFIVYLFFGIDFCLYRNRYMVAKQW